MEEEEAVHGLPPEVPPEVVQQWIQYVARELRIPPANRSHINDYAYTNEQEYFAVLAEYFFKSPDVLREKDPKLYQMLRKMFHQDARRLPKLTLQRGEASKLSRSFLPGFGSGGVALLMVQKEIFQACRFGGGSLAAQVFPTGQHEGSANLLQSDLRIFPPQLPRVQTDESQGYQHNANDVSNDT